MVHLESQNIGARKKAAKPLIKYSKAKVCLLFLAAADISGCEKNRPSLKKKPLCYAVDQN